MTKSIRDSEIMLDRMEEICPSITIDNSSFDELMADVNVAFRIVGYTPINLEKCVKLALNKIHYQGDLWRLCYHAWRLDS